MRIQSSITICYFFCFYPTENAFTVTSTTLYDYDDVLRWDVLLRGLALAVDVWLCLCLLPGERPASVAGAPWILQHAGDGASPISNGPAGVPYWELLRRRAAFRLPRGTVRGDKARDQRELHRLLLRGLPLRGGQRASGRGGVRRRSAELLPRRLEHSAHREEGALHRGGRRFHPH